MLALDTDEASPRQEKITTGNKARKGVADEVSRALFPLLGTVGVITPPLVMVVILAN